jgi:hypothetical protein
MSTFRKALLFKAVIHFDRNGQNKMSNAGLAVLSETLKAVKRLKCFKLALRFLFSSISYDLWGGFWHSAEVIM